MSQLAGARALLTTFGAASWLLATSVWPAASTSATPVAEIDVIASTPLSGANLAAAQAQGDAVILDSATISRTEVPSLTDAILGGSASATVNDVAGNPFEPDILFRGFTASPVAGTAEGLAVYVDGARFNEPFGDTVQWDLIPPSAIASASLESANPLFGLNALGGSLNVRLKDGFSFDGRRLTAYGGSYGRRALDAELGGRAGNWAYYLAADLTHDDGFRQTGQSDLARAYGDLGWRGGPLTLDLGLTLAHDTLGNPGATPVQALAADPSSIFTAPNTVDNRYAGATLNAGAAAGPTTRLLALAYGQTLTQHVPNGTTVDIEPCDDGSGLLCNDDGTVVTGPGQRPIADFLSGGPYSGLSTQNFVVHAYGAAAQVDETAPIAGRANNLVAGVGYDGSDSIFAGQQALGGFDPFTREYLGPGVVIDDPSEGINPVRVLSVTRAWAAFATDTVSVGHGLDLTLAGRFNALGLDLKDQLGGPVRGRHDFRRFNPSAGLAWRLTQWLALRARYAETNRAPTPQELSCASAATPCSLLGFFVGDPSLRQVVARTIEVGARGGVRDWRWDADYFHDATSNEIVYQSPANNPNLAFFSNIGGALRQGVETSLRYSTSLVTAALSYTYLDAIFSSAFILNAGANPGGNANGLLHVLPGDRIPGLPRHRVALEIDWRPTSRWTLGATLEAQSPAFRFGDPTNTQKPTPGYAVLDLNAAWRLSRAVTLFALVNNVTDARYDTYGSFGPVNEVPWPNIPGGVTDPRTASPGAPIGGYVGARFGF